MRKIKFIVLLLSSLVFFNNLEAGEKGAAKNMSYKAIGKAKVYSGPEGQKVTVVALEPRTENKFILYFEGFEGEWNEKAILHKRVEKGSTGEDFVASANGKDWTTVASRNSSWWAGYKNMTIQPKGDREGMFSYSEEDSKTADANAIIAKYVP